MCLSALAMNSVSDDEDQIQLKILSAHETLDESSDPINSFDNVSCRAKTGTCLINRGITI